MKGRLVKFAARGGGLDNRGKVLIYQRYEGLLTVYAAFDSGLFV